MGGPPLSSAPAPTTRATHLDVDDHALGGPRRPLLAMPSASRASSRPWWERDDPFWSPELWVRPPTWRFASRQPPVQLTRPIGAPVVRWIPVPDFEVTRPRLLSTSPHVRRAVAVLAAWHHLSAKQLAAFLGYPGTKIGEILRPMFKAGLVERGRYGMGEVRYHTNYLYRLRDDKPLHDWLATLPAAERLAVTAGRRLRVGGAHVRHDLLAAELGLRVMETQAGIQAVWGESLCEAESLFDDPDAGSFRADLGVVRGDGLRIVVELCQARQRRDLEGKMARWGRLLGRHTWDTSGTVVVFLNAKADSRDADDHAKMAALLRRCHARSISADGLAREGVRARGTEVARARMQIHLASWADWFPGPQVLSEEFARLTTAYTSDGRTWERTDLAQSRQGLPFKPDLPGRWRAPERARRSLLAAPPWLGGRIASRV